MVECILNQYSYGSFVENDAEIPDTQDIFFHERPFYFNAFDLDRIFNVSLISTNSA